jgi:Flp pilus assembly protein TadD
LDNVSPNATLAFRIKAGVRYRKATSSLLLFLLPILALAQLPEAQLQDLNLGAQLAKAGRYRDGMRIASSAAQRFPNDTRVFQMLGYFQTKLQLNRDAVRSYARALQLDPASSEANVGLGTAQFSAGLEDEAIRTLEKGLVKFPDDATHYQALGVVLLRVSEQGRDTKARAGSMFEKALRIDSALPEAHYELGAMALQANDFRTAEDHLLAAERSAPNDSRIHFALARLYRMQAKPEAADQEMKAFLSAK